MSPVEHIYISVVLYHISVLLPCDVHEVHRVFLSFIAFRFWFRLAAWLLNSQSEIFRIPDSPPAFRSIAYTDRKSSRASKRQGNEKQPTWRLGWPGSTCIGSKFTPGTGTRVVESRNGFRRKWRPTERSDVLVTQFAAVEVVIRDVI